MMARSLVDPHEKMPSSPNTAAYLGTTSKRIFEFVRQKLGVPLHCGLVDYPSPTKGPEVDGRKELTDTQISLIYEALRSREFFIPLSALNVESFDVTTYLVRDGVSRQELDNGIRVEEETRT
jgi:hypothetical protein